ncbi:MAG: HAD family hydrolase [Candidatus Cryptobacteroides sp.]|nr:HAD family phosphatase [Bacteroidales bacterium]
MYKNIIFDFGAVLVDWNPHHVFDSYFGDRDKAEWFITHICDSKWNAQMDCGKPFAQGVAELAAVHPEWKKEIELYWRNWKGMMGGPIPGMLELVRELKDSGLKIYGLTNWSAETFYTIVDEYPVFSLLDGKVVSGEEKLIKPDPAIYRLLLDRYSLDPSESIFVDDNPANVETASTLGIKGIRFISAGQVRKEFESLGIIDAQ